MDLRDDNRKPKRSARSRARTRLIEEDAETEYSYGSLENSGTESSIHGDESSNLGDGTPARELSTERSSLSRVSKIEEKRCVFCWRGKKSSLGQGILTRCEPTPGFNPFRKTLKGRQNSNDSESSKRRNKGEPVKSLPKRPVETGKYANVYNELTDVGLPLDVLASDIFDESDRAVYAHHCCAAWSEGVLQAEDYSLQSVDKAALVGLTSKCNFCEKFGATIPCKAPKCGKKFHYPCASGSGCFQDISSLTLLCPDHAEMAEVIAKDESHCVVCGQPGIILKQLFCTSCGQHYHGDCLEFEIECNTVVRAGWQCPDCKLCQECRNPGDDNKMLVCDVCDKGFHTFCLVPAIQKVPPNGWRCHNCRSCEECGQKYDDIKWHRNYTICDNCHMQKQRGPVCPVCKKVYKLFNNKGMTMCTVCKKYVHNACDKEIDKADVKKYKCSACVPASASTSAASSKEPCVAVTDVTLEDTMEVTEQQHFESDSELADSEKMSTSSSSSRIRPVKPGKGKPASFTRGSSAIKRPPSKSTRTSAPLGVRSKGKVMKKRSRPAPTDNRVKRSKMTETIATTHSAAPSAESIKKLDDEDQHAAVVLAAASDLFVLTQDMCVSCGSFGSESEGDLITCTQCGQCYHPFCAQVKVNSVILTKGWRCLDCTVCEGCGKPTDEPNLLLCDECDISFHTYCLDPPLKHVPKGNWKCKWCVHCRYCGSASPGYGCEWINNYTECGPCHSVTDCPVCSQCYMDNELVIQCTQCERWLHTACDNMHTEDDAERMSNLGYNCVFCRPKTGAPSPSPPTPVVQPPTPLSITSPGFSSVPVKEEPKSYLVDGINLSENGLGLMKQLAVEVPPSQISLAQKAAQAARLAKNRQMKIKQSHPQMSQLLSVTTEMPDVPMEEDGVGNAAADPTRSSLDADTDSLLTEALLSPAVSEAARGDLSTDVLQSTLTSDGAPLTDAACTDANKIKKRARKPPPLGIGGFVAKPRQRPPTKIVMVVQGPYTADGQPPAPPTDAAAAEGVSVDGKKKIVRKMRKKGQIEDAYPSYLQEAFFGKSTLEQSKAEPSTSILQQNQPATDSALELSISNPKVIPQDCTIKLAEGVTIPSSEPQLGIANILDDPSEVTNKDGNVSDEVHHIDGEDLDILKGVPGEMLHGELPDELYKIFQAIESDLVDTREAGPSDSKSATRAEPVESEMDLVDSNFEEFLKGIMETGEETGELPDMPVSGETADAVSDAMSLHSKLSTSPLPMQGLSQPILNQQQPLHPSRQPSLHQPQAMPQSYQPPMHMPHQQPIPQLQQIQPQLQRHLQQPQQQLQQQIHQQQLHHPPQLPSSMQAPMQGSMHDSFNMNMPSSFITAPPSASPVETAVQAAPNFHQPPHTQMMPAAAPSSVASSLPGSVSGSHPGTPFSPSTFNEPNWPTNTSSATAAADQDEGDRMSLNQKNMLKWRDDEPLGLDATISPVLFANMKHPELKQQFPDWTERCKQIGKFWRKMPTEQRAPYLKQAQENRNKRSKMNKTARKKQSKESPLGSPRGAGMSPGSASSLKTGDPSVSESGAVGTTFQPPQTPLGSSHAMDPYSCPPATPGIVQQPATPRETGTAIGSQEGTSDLIRDEAYSQPPPTPYTPSAIMQPPTPMDTSGEVLADDAAQLSSSAGLGMNTEDVRKQHLRELLVTKPPGSAVDAVTWHPVGTAGMRAEYPGPRSVGYPVPRGWHPHEGPSSRGQFGPRGDGWPGVSGPPGHQMNRPPPRGRFIVPSSMYRQRPPGAGVYSTRFQGPHHMMVDGSRMPSRMVQPQGLLPYDDSYQIRHAHAPRLVDALQGHGQMVVGSEHGASRPGGIHPNQEEGLEDLLNTDDLSLLPFIDPVLDETLAEEHDKNMFDEHLGLKKDVDVGKQSELSAPIKSEHTFNTEDATSPTKMYTNVKTPRLPELNSFTTQAVSAAPISSGAIGTSKMAATVTATLSDSSLVSAGGKLSAASNVKTEVAKTSTAMPQPTAQNANATSTAVCADTTATNAMTSSSAATGISTTSSTASGNAAVAVSSVARTPVSSGNLVSSASSSGVPPAVMAESTSASTTALTITSRTTSTTTSSPQLTRAASTAASSQFSTVVGRDSPHITTSQVSASSPHPQAGGPTVADSSHIKSSASVISGSPHPQVGGAMVPGSPHFKPGGPMVPGSPHPHSAGSIVPGSPHPYAGGAMVPGSPHPLAGIPSSPLRHSGGPVPGSPHPGVIVSNSPHTVIGGHQAMHGGSPHSSLMSGSPHQQISVQSPAGGLETRPYPSQSALDQPPVFQRSPSVGRMLGGPQYPGGTNLPHSSLPGFAAIPAYHQPAAAFTNQHHQLHAQPRPYFGSTGSHGDMGSPSSFNRMMDTRGSNPLQDLLDEEKRLQQSKLDGDAGNRATTSLLSDQDFEKLKADVVNDPCGSANFPQTSPRARFDTHQVMSEVWHSQPNMSGEFQPPPPPPYPGTGRMTPGMHMRAPFLPDHRASVMSPMPPQSPGPRMPMGHGPAMADIKEEDLKYRNWLHNKDMALQERLSQAENELTSAKKKKKALGNKQKTLKKKNEDLSVMDAQHLEKINTSDIPMFTKHLEAIRTEHKNHQRLMQEYNMKNQERMMHWGGGHMPRHPGYPPMMHQRMRGMFPQPRHVDPRQIEFGRVQQQQRMQMMHVGGPPRPGMHGMQRPPYHEGSMDNKGFMGPRFASMPQMMPLKADGTEMTEEENKRFMMQHAGSMQRPAGMRPVGIQEFGVRMQQPSHMQPRFPGDVSRVKSNVPPGGLQRSKSVPQPKSKATPTTSAGPAKQLNKEVKPDEGPSLHMTEIPASFAGQHLVSTPKPIVSAVPFSSATAKDTTSLQEIPSDAMTSFGGQYPLKIVKTEPLSTPETTQGSATTTVVSTLSLISSSGQVLPILSDATTATTSSLKTPTSQNSVASSTISSTVSSIGQTTSVTVEPATTAITTSMALSSAAASATATTTSSGNTSASSAAAATVSLATTTVPSVTTTVLSGNATVVSSATTTTTVVVSSATTTPSPATITPSLTSTTGSIAAASVDGTTLEQRMIETIDSVAKGAGEMIWREDRNASRREAERRGVERREAEKREAERQAQIAVSATSISYHPSLSAAGVHTHMSSSNDGVNHTGILTSAMTTCGEQAISVTAVSTPSNQYTALKPPELNNGAGTDVLSSTSDSNALLKRLLENPKAPMQLQGADNAKTKLAHITPVQQRNMEAAAAPPSTYALPQAYSSSPLCNNVAAPYCRQQVVPFNNESTFDPFPWNPQLGISADAWAALTKKDKQHIYEARMTPEGQIITDNGTIISVPNSSRPVYPMNPMQMSLGPSAMKPGPLHAMQNMRSALSAEGGMSPHPVIPINAPVKKKKSTQIDKKKRNKPNTPTNGLPPSMSLPGAGQPGLPSAGCTPSAALSEPTALYEEAKHKLTSQPHLNLQDPVLSAIPYTSPMIPTKPLRVPSQRVVTKPKPPKLVGSYGRACIEGRYDLYSYVPYTNLPVPSHKLVPETDTSRKGSTPKPSKAADTSLSADMYDISRFQKVMSKTQIRELCLPSPPTLCPPKSSSLSLNAESIINPSSPAGLAMKPMINMKSHRDIEYPFLKPIKETGTAEMSSSYQESRMSPELSVQPQVPVRMDDYAEDILAKVKEEPMGTQTAYEKESSLVSTNQDELKSTAVGIQSSLQSAIRESPSNQVSVTLTVSSQTAHQIPDVLSQLADLLRMTAPISYKIEHLSDESKDMLKQTHSVGVCCHCQTLLPSEYYVAKKERNDTSDVSSVVKEEFLDFCNNECANSYYSASQPHTTEAAKVESGAGGEQRPVADNRLPVKPVSKKSKRRANEPPVKPNKKWRGIRWRHWDIKVTFDLHKYEAPSDEDIKEIWKKVGQIVKPKSLEPDARVCTLCHQTGDGVTNVASRLLNHDVDKWVHLNCALWSTEVYETLNGALINIDLCIKRGAQISCVVCGTKGATLGCFKLRCPNVYHVSCAFKQGAMFFQDKTILCPVHMPKESPEQLKQLTVARKVYINRDESLQIANAVRNDEKQCSVRIGAVVYYSIGQLFTHQLLTGRFHTRDYIYPVGYRCVRFFWSIRQPNTRCCYECSIVEGDEGSPLFVITMKETGYPNKVYQASNPKDAWTNILDVVESKRRIEDCVKIFPEYLSGEYMFGLKEPAIIRIIESLPGTELLAGYAFKFGKTQLIEMPPAINPTGCARSEPKLRTHFRKPHTLQSNNPRSHVVPSMTTVALPADANSPYHKQFVHSKSQQYRKLKNEWRNYVYLGRSRIQGLGMFAARDIEKHTMVIEYIGEVIRNELAEYREKIYNEHNRGVYMFRITEDYVIDATMSGGPARYINHSCNPNCVTETIQMDKDVKIVIIALRRIAKGEELNYDYKFALEDDSSKIPCNCGANNCRKWMN